MTEEIKAGVKFVEVTYMRAFKVWWSFLWRVLLFSLVLGIALGFILGFVLSIAGVESKTIGNICLITGLIIGVPLNVAITKSVLKNRYSDFRIALIEE